MQLADMSRESYHYESSDFLVSTSISSFIFFKEFISKHNTLQSER